MSWAGSAMAAIRTMRQNRAMLQSQKKRRFADRRRELLTKSKPRSKAALQPPEVKVKARGAKRNFQFKLSWFNRNMELVLFVVVLLVIAAVLYMMRNQ